MRNQEIEKIPPLKTETGQSVAFHASPTARNIAFVIYPVLVRSTSSFSPNFIHTKSHDLRTVDQTFASLYLMD